jgi:glycerate 2-kinase
MRIRFRGLVVWAQGSVAATRFPNGRVSIIVNVMRPSKAAKESGASLPAQARSILAAALREVDAGTLVARRVTRRGHVLRVCGISLNLNDFEKIYVVAFGKAAPAMAASLARILGRRLTRGIVVAPQGPGFVATNVRFHPAAHPLPDERSMRAGREILNLAGEAGSRDLLFVLISGGGSALVCLPAPPVALVEKREITEGLLRAGADIAELNAVRKHLSAIKGGRLAEAAFPARVVNLVLSDVVGNNLESIASGPSYWDSSTYGGAVRILKKYDLWRDAPGSVRAVLTEGALGRRKETLRRGDKAFRQVSTEIVGDNLLALRGAACRAKELGWRPDILTSGDSGEAGEAARRYVLFLEDLASSGEGVRRRLCLLAGGELTVRVRGRGRGGRNTEFALAALAEMTRRPERDFRFLIASVGTDGRDGSGDAAGAWVTRSTIGRAARLGLDPERYLRDNDSYSFFEKAGGLIVTGPTRTNVMDIRLFLLAPPPPGRLRKIRHEGRTSRPATARRRES